MAFHSDEFGRGFDKAIESIIVLCDITEYSIEFSRRRDQRIAVVKCSKEFTQKLYKWALFQEDFELSYISSLRVRQRPGEDEVHLIATST